ncbi:hypothetical protein B0T12DRAFT_484161 [Alternaria alternata]|nr:hypothetical protein B0T12DRAFT_484161 [Alternaria alternata]
MAVDDAVSSTVDVVPSARTELEISDDSAGCSVLVGVTSKLVVLSDSVSVIVRVSSLADGVDSEELVTMAEGVTTMEVTAEGVTSTSLEIGVTSTLTVDVEGISTDEDTISETSLVEDELPATGVEASGDVMVTVSVEETTSGLAVIVDDDVSVKVASDGVESSEEDDEGTSGVVTADEDESSEVSTAAEDKIMISEETAADDETTSGEATTGEEETSGETTAEETASSEDVMEAEDAATTEEETAGVEVALDDDGDTKALLDLVGVTEDDVDDLKELDVKRVEDIRPLDERIDVVRVEEEVLAEELLIGVVRVEVVRVDADRVEDDRTEDARTEDDRTELVVDLTELEEERMADEERAEVCKVDEERALGQTPKSDLQPAPQ